MKEKVLYILKFCGLALLNSYIIFISIYFSLNIFNKIFKLIIMGLSLLLWSIVLIKGPGIKEYTLTKKIIFTTLSFIILFTFYYICSHYNIVYARY
jgi:cytochrome c oxidase assembly factor CtaG